MSAAASSVSLRALLHLAWPIVIARSSQAVIGFADALMVAPLGEKPLAAATTGSLNSFAMIIMPMGMVFIAQSFAAQLMGKNRVDVAVRYAWYALGLALLAMLAGLAAIPLVGPALGLIGYDPEVHDLMTRYIQVRMLGIGAAVGTEALGNWYGGLGVTRLHMIAGVVAMASNVGLNWVLIYGNLGAPALGCDGAAIASTIASWIGFAVVAVAFWRKVSLPVKSVRPAGLALRELTRMLRFGLPHGLNWFLEFAAFAIFINAVIGGLGTSVLAAMMVVLNINSVSFMPAFGLSSAGAILTGQAIGRGEHDLVPRITYRTLKITLCWQGTIGLLYVLAPAPLMSLFAGGNTDTESMLAVGAVLLAISGAWQLFDAAGITLSEALRSAGDTAWTLWARIVLAWTLFIPASFVAVKLLGYGYVAAISCVVAYIAVLAFVLAWRFRSGAWRRINLTEVEPDLVSDELRAAAS